MLMRSHLSLTAWIEPIQHLCKAIFIHPSLEYIQIFTGHSTPPLLKDLKDQKKTWIDRLRKEQTSNLVPIVDLA